MVLVTPAFLLIFALGIVPVVCVIVFSLGKVQPALLTWSYMGLDNYAEVLKDSSFWSSLGITLYFTVVSVLLLVFLMLLAALQTVSQTLVEAARVDGAGAFKRFFHVYLPGMKPMILVVLVLRTIQAFKVFDVIYTMTKGGPNNGTMTISFFTYYEIYKYLNYGKGAAISLIILVIMLAFTALYKRLLRTDD